MKLREIIFQLFAINLATFGRCCAVENQTRKISTDEKVTKVENLSGNFDRFENLTDECGRAMVEFEGALRRLEWWAMEMYDSTAKLPSGILSGNLNQFGDFDQCLAIAGPFQGKFCLASIMMNRRTEVQASSAKFYEELRHKILGGDVYVSKFSDVSHISPKSSEIKFAICVPSVCSAEDAKNILNEMLGQEILNLPLSLDIEIRDEMCQVKNEEKRMKFDEKIVIISFLTIFCVVLSSTLVEIFFESENSLIKALSLKTNFLDLTSTQPRHDDMLSIHCLRSIFAIILLIAHKTYEVNFYSISRKLQVNKAFMRPFTIIFRMGHLHTDVFLMLSGFLVTHSIFKKNQKVNFLSEIFNRYFRLIPTVLAVMLFITFVQPHLGEGPQWPMLIDYQAWLCRQTWWHNVLMMQNLMKIGDICMMHTHHIATDFQLSMIGPIVAVAMLKFPAMTSTFVVGGSLAVTVVRFFKSYFDGLSVFVTEGRSVDQLMNHDSIFHVLPHYRITSYSIGIFLAYFLIKFKNRKLSDFQLNLGWLIAVSSFVATSVICSACLEGSKINLALFHSICSITFCFFVAWVIFTTELGYKNIFSSIIEWKVWKIMANLSYSIYLVQFAVFHYNISIAKSSLEFNWIGTLVDFNEISMILCAALVLTLFIDYPCRNLKKLLTKQKSKLKAN